MRFIADENLHQPIIDYLQQTHDVLSIRDSGLSGISDNEIYNLACKENRIIITMDKDFSRLFQFPPHKCGGIIVVKIYKRSVQETFNIFKNLFEKIDISKIPKNLTIMTADGIRIKKYRNP